ncbi:MAG: hypothetical protein ABIN01_21865 [Ferruginibacter sp.]
MLPTNPFRIFNGINVPGSWNTERFRIVFKAVTALPITFSTVKALQQKENIEID